jgi:hypothetical protein
LEAWTKALNSADDTAQEMMKSKPRKYPILKAYSRITWENERMGEKGIGGIE